MMRATLPGRLVLAHASRALLLVVIAGACTRAVSPESSPAAPNETSAAPPNTPADSLRVLFIGNSLTYFNDMPAMVRALADSAREARPMRVQAVACGARAAGRTVGRRGASAGTVRRTGQPHQPVRVRGPIRHTHSRGRCAARTLHGVAIHGARAGLRWRARVLRKRGGASKWRVLPGRRGMAGGMAKAACFAPLFGRRLAFIHHQPARTSLRL
jgi:hypothetical protein